jgi:signal peptidase
MARSSLRSVLFIAVIILLFLILIGQQFGQPLGVGYVVSGSMEPTLQAGDGFIAIPPALAGNLSDGTVVTFEARELNGGGLTTHRIVGETSEGYITRGDANPFTDQDGSEPPVQETQIVAVALQVDGEVVVIPELGTVALTLQSVFEFGLGVVGRLPGGDQLADGNVGTLMVALGGGLLLYSVVAEARAGRRTSRSRSRSRDGALRASLVLLVILGLVLLPATAAMVVPSGINDLTIVSSETASSDPSVIERGGSQTINYTITNDGFVPQVAIIEPASSGVSVSDTTHVVHRGETATTTAVLSAPSDTGVYYRAIAERQYLGLLPVGLIVALHMIHPVVAIIVIDLVLASVVSAVFALSVGFRPLRFRDTSRESSTADRIRRFIRRWR